MTPEKPFGREPLCFNCGLPQNARVLPDHYEPDEYRDIIAGALRRLGLNPIAMADTDCGWVVSASVEATGAWSTVPDGGWTRDG